MNYIIELKADLENMADCVCCIIHYLGEEKCFSTFNNYYNKYKLKTRDISFTEYCPLSIQKKTNSVFQCPMIMALAEEAINTSFKIIEAELTIEQINYLKTMDFIENIQWIL